MLLVLLQETLAVDLAEAQQEQAELNSELMRVSQDRDKLAQAVSTAHIRYNKQLETMRERLRAYEDLERQNTSSKSAAADSESTEAEMARLEAEVTRLRGEMKTSELQARQADAKCQSLAAAYEKQLAAAMTDAEKAKANATAAVQNAAVLYAGPFCVPFTAGTRIEGANWPVCSCSTTLLPTLLFLLTHPSRCHC